MIEIVTFYQNLILFIVPGYFLATCFFPRVRNPAFLVAVGFVISLAVLAMPAWPCLWYRTQASTFWGILAAVWFVYFFAALWAWAHRPPVAREPGSESLDGSEVTAGGTDPRGGGAWLIRFAPLAYLIWAAVFSHGLLRRLNPPSSGVWFDWTALTTCLLFGIVGIPEVRKVRRCLRDSAPDAPPRWWTITACAVIAALAVGVTLQARPDWDDGEYLADIERYTEGGRLNGECASLPREGLPVAAHMRLLSWELFGATLCRLSGVHPMVSHRTLLPPVLLLMVFAVHWEVLAELVLPRRLVPLAILGLAVYWAFGNPSYNAAGNLLLTRPWQGKAMLLFLGLPLEVLALWRFLREPSIRSWICCAVVATGTLAMSSSAVYMLACLVPACCLTFALALETRGARRWWTPPAAMTSAGSIVIYGLILRSAMAKHPFLTARPKGDCWQAALSIGVNQTGDLGVIWLLALPTLCALLPSRRAMAFLVGVPLILALTVVNPAAYSWVSSHLTSSWTYRRLFWLFPMGLGFAALVAVVPALITASLPKRFGATSILGIVLALGLALGLFVPAGRFAWSPENVGPYPGLEPCWGQTAEKVPADLLFIIQNATGRPKTEGRLLFAEHLCPFIVPYSSRLRFVSSRPSYTYESLTEAGRRQEGLERVSLAVTFLGFNGTAREYFGSSLLELGEGNAETRRVLDKYQVNAIIVDSKTRITREVLLRSGFVLTQRRGKYRLWVRSETVPATQAARRGRHRDEASPFRRADASGPGRGLSGNRLVFDRETLYA